MLKRIHNRGLHPRKAIWARSLAYKRLERKPCEACGAPKSDAHHHDYSKPLDVKWLCKKHHFEIHYPPSERKRDVVAIPVSPEIHRKIKVTAFLRGQTITELATQFWTMFEAAQGENLYTPQPKHGLELVAPTSGFSTRQVA